MVSARAPVFVKMAFTLTGVFSFSSNGEIKKIPTLPLRLTKMVAWGWTWYILLLLTKGGYIHSHLTLLGPIQSDITFFQRQKFHLPCVVLHFPRYERGHSKTRSLQQSDRTKGCISCVIGTSIICRYDKRDNYCDLVCISLVTIYRLCSVNPNKKATVDFTYFKCADSTNLTIYGIYRLKNNAVCTSLGLLRSLDHIVLINNDTCSYKELFPLSEIQH